MFKGKIVDRGKEKIIDIYEIILVDTDLTAIFWDNEEKEWLWTILKEVTPIAEEVRIRPEDVRLCGCSGNKTKVHAIDISLVREGDHDE
jgi:hypothetical protein